MQLKKTSKKTPKIAEKAVIPAPEKAAEPEVAAKPRASKTSKAKKSEGAEMTSGKHLHKSASPAAIPDAIVLNEVTKAAPSTRIESKPLGNVPSRTVHAHQIAELAYSYWVQRGHNHGSAEEDWLRAERELSGR